jgi:hypothetical protein
MRVRTRYKRQSTVPRVPDRKLGELTPDEVRKTDPTQRGFGLGEKMRRDLWPHLVCVRLINAEKTYDDPYPQVAPRVRPKPVMY